MTQPTTPVPAASTIRRRSIVVPTGAAPTTPAPSAEFLPPGVVRNPIGSADAPPEPVAAAPQPEPPQPTAPAAPTEEPVTQDAALPARVAAEAASIDPKPATPPSPKGRGNHYGPGGLPQEKRDEIAALAKAGKNASEISAQIGIGRLTVTKYMPKGAAAAVPSSATPAAAPTPKRRGRARKAKAAGKAAAPKVRRAVKRTAQAKPVGAPTPGLAVLFAQLLRDKKVDAETALKVVPAVELVSALI